MLEAKHFIRQIKSAWRFYKLLEVLGKESEIHQVNRIFPGGAGPGKTVFAVETGLFISPAIGVPADTKTQLQVIGRRVAFLVMIDHHAHVLGVPLGNAAVSFNAVLNGARRLALLFLYYTQVIQHHRMLLR